MWLQNRIDNVQIVAKRGLPDSKGHVTREKPYPTLRVCVYWIEFGYKEHQHTTNYFSTLEIDRNAKLRLIVLTEVAAFLEVRQCEIIVIPSMRERSACHAEKNRREEYLGTGVWCERKEGEKGYLSIFLKIHPASSVNSDCFWVWKSILTGYHNGGVCENIFWSIHNDQYI